MDFAGNLEHFWQSTGKEIENVDEVVQLFDTNIIVDLIGSALSSSCWIVKLNLDGIGTANKREGSRELGWRWF